MPRITPTSLLRQAINSALKDRRNFLDCHASGDPMRVTIQGDIDRLEALRSARFEDLDEAQRRTAFLAFVCAESWHDSLADSMGKAPRGENALYAKRNRRIAERLRTLRRATLGLSRHEAHVQECREVNIFDFLQKRFLP